MSTALLTASEVARYLSRLGTELDQTVGILKDADLDAATKRHAADIAESRAFVEADGSMDMRRHKARLAVEHQEMDALVAEALTRHLKTKLRSIETRIEIGRSYGAAVRAELRTLPGQEG
jgi:hypothetical protein